MFYQPMCSLCGMFYSVSQIVSVKIASHSTRTLQGMRRLDCSCTSSIRQAAAAAHCAKLVAFMWENGFYNNITLPPKYSHILLSSLPTLLVFTSHGLTMIKDTSLETVNIFCNLFSCRDTLIMLMYITS